MRNQIILTFLIGSFIACSSDKEIDIVQCPAEQCPEKWQLIKMTGNIANMPPLTGSDMTWQEWFILYPDYTFIKTRERDNIATEESGTYATVTLSDGEYLELVYQSNNDLIGNCTGDAIEVLRINSEEELVGTWPICDGPGLYYEKTEYNCGEN